MKELQFVRKEIIKNDKMKSICHPRGKLKTIKSAIIRFSCQENFSSPTRMKMSFLSKLQ